MSVFQTWRDGRLPQLPRDQRFEVVPDWVCENLSPSTESKDRQIKMPIYARYGVGFTWLVEPLKQTLDAFALEGGQWRSLGAWREDETASVPPFEALRLNLRDLWS